MLTTDLPEYQQNTKTSDEDINELIVEVRERTGENYQVVEYCDRENRWFRKPIYHYWYGLYYECGGFFPFQVLTCANTAKEVKCYLYGLLSGLDRTENS